MTCWYKITLTWEQAGKREDEAILQALTPLIERIQAQAQHAAAVFERQHERGFDLILSPEVAHAAKYIIRTYGGGPCDKPRAHEVTPLLGSPRALSLLD